MTAEPDKEPRFEVAQPTPIVSYRSEDGYTYTTEAAALEQNSYYALVRTIRELDRSVEGEPTLLQMWRLRRHLRWLWLEVPPPDAPPVRVERVPTWRGMSPRDTAVLVAVTFACGLLLGGVLL